jgi:hypothetical protein
MFYPGSLNRIRTFSHPGSRIRILICFHPGPYLNSGMQTYIFLAPYGIRCKVLVFDIVKKIRGPRSEKNSSRIRDPGGKKAPDPGSGSATLVPGINGSFFWIHIQDMRTCTGTIIQYL